MKLIVLFFVFCSLNLFAQNNTENKTDKLAGKVKTVVEQEYIMKYTFGIGSKVFFNKINRDFDNIGNEIEVKAFNKKGKIDYRETYIYNPQGFLSESMLYNEDNIQETRLIHIYNNKNKLAETDEMDAKNSLIKKSIFHYDDNGKQIDFINYEADNRIEFKTINKFDISGNKIREDYYNKNDSLEFILEFKYDSNGRETEQDYLDPTGILAFKTTYKYEDMDSHGNWLKKLIYENNKLKIINKRTVVYF